MHESLESNLDSSPLLSNDPTQPFVPKNENDVKENQIQQVVVFGSRPRAFPQAQFVAPEISFDHLKYISLPNILWSILFLDLELV